MSRLRIATMAPHGICGAAARVSGEILFAASPRISMARTTAKSSIRSTSRSAWVRPAMNCATASAASTMWRRRTRSSSRILRLGGPQYLFAEISAEILRRAQVDLLPSQQAGQLRLHGGQPEQARLTARLELHQEVDVA